MWLHGGASNLCRRTEGPGGGTVAAVVFLKTGSSTHPHPPNPIPSRFLLIILFSPEQMLITDCFQKEAIIDSEEKAHLPLINTQQITR